jgi:hypothetical protein
MTTLHLGVIEQSYGWAVPPNETKLQEGFRVGRRRKKRTTGSRSAVTTGDVAEILEAKYHVMEVFYELNKEKIGDLIVRSLAGRIETIQQGGYAGYDEPYTAATSVIEDMFKQFLSQKIIERIGIPGVPTKAALAGVSHRFKHPYAKREPRPSFIDTGLYQASFKTWVD